MFHTATMTRYTHHTGDTFWPRSTLLLAAHAPSNQTLNRLVGYVHLQPLLLFAALEVDVFWCTVPLLRLAA